MDDYKHANLLLAVLKIFLGVSISKCLAKTECLVRTKLKKKKE